ncbi:hypothetical protein Q9189_003765 [Teloschistes chrysophthalmus]
MTPLWLVPLMPLNVNCSQCHPRTVTSRVMDPQLRTRQPGAQLWAIVLLPTIEEED